MSLNHKPFDQSKPPIQQKGAPYANVTYDNTQLPLHDMVGRYAPLDLRIMQVLISTSLESVNERTKYGQNSLHIVCM